MKRSLDRVAGGLKVAEARLLDAQRAGSSRDHAITALRVFALTGAIAFPAVDGLVDPWKPKAPERASGQAPETPATQHRTYVDVNVLPRPTDGDTPASKPIEVTQHLTLTVPEPGTTERRVEVAMLVPEGERWYRTTLAQGDLLLALPEQNFKMSIDSLSPPSDRCDDGRGVRNAAGARWCSVDLGFEYPTGTPAVVAPGQAAVCSGGAAPVAPFACTFSQAGSTTCFTIEVEPVDSERGEDVDEIALKVRWSTASCP